MKGVQPEENRSRVAFVTSVYPHGQEYGAQQRVLNTLRILRGLGDVTVVLVLDGAPDLASIARTRDEFGSVVVFELGATPLNGLVERLRFEFDSKQTNTSFFSINEIDRTHLTSLIAEHDLVWVHTLRTANECGIYAWPRSVLDLDDLPSHLSASSTSVLTGLLRRLKERRMSRIWKRREQRVFERFEMVTVCSEADRTYVGGGAQVTVVPNGYPAPEGKPVRSPVQPPRLGFVGGLWGRPNLDGVSWFIGDIWPRIRAKVPDARLRLVGKGSGESLSNDDLGIEQLGYVDDPRAEIGTWSGTIVPIRIGGGTRVKIAQAFSRNCPVVATTLGAYGYPIRSGDELLLADDPEAFASACIRLLQDEAFGAAIAERAWHRFQREWTWDAVGDRLVPVLKGLIERRSANQRRR